MTRKAVIAGLAMSFAFGGAAGGAPTEQEALGTARRVANTFTDTLRDQLNANVQEKGAADSLPQCYYQALTLRKEIETTNDVKVKRTSSRLRNARNAPDGYEREALGRFEKFAKQGSMPTDEIRRETLDGKAVFRYVRPITVGASCLPCHGEAASLAAGVKRVLEEKYPDDQAVGYKEGDFRGLLSEVIPAE
jgi:hypothetical protein